MFARALLRQALPYGFMMTVRLGAVLSGLILTLFVTNTLSETEASTFFLFMAVAYILAAVLSLGLEHANIREAATESFHNSQDLLASHIGKRSLIVFCVALVVSVGGSTYLSIILDDRSANFSFMINACSLIVATTLVSAIIHGYGYASTSIFFTRLFIPITTILVSLLLSSSGMKIWHSFVISAAISSLFAVLVVLNLKQSEVSVSQQRHIKLQPRDLIFLICISAGQQIFIWQGQIFSTLMGAQEMGATLTVAQRAAVLVSFAQVCLNAVNAPKFARYLEDRDLHKLFALGVRSTLFSLGFAIVAATCIIWLKEDVMGTFGEEYRTRTFDLKILCLIQVFSCAFGPVGQILLMAKDRKDSALSYIISIFFGTGVLFVATGTLDLAHAPLWAICATLVCKNVVDALYVRRIFSQQIRSGIQVTDRR